MTSQALNQELLRQLQRLEPGQRRQVLDFARALADGDSTGTTGSTLTRFAGHISRADLDVMASEIESACEQVRADEW